MIRPPPLRPGDTIAVVAPSSPFEPVLAWVGLGFLARRYRVIFDRSMFTRTGYLAGSDARRRDELAAALRDPDVRAIVAARGGYGATRFVHELEAELAELPRAPRWIVGFSDITALHLEATRVGVCSLHACHVTSLGRGDERARASLVRALEEPDAPRTFEGLDMIRPGVAEGPLVGGNLTLIQTAAAAGRLALPRGAVLLVEDVTERPYRIDRMLSSLIVGGHLAHVSAVVVGEFFACDPGPDGITVHEVVRERLGALGVPVVANAPIGHGARNEPVVLGARARVEASPSGGVLRIG